MKRREESQPRKETALFQNANTPLKRKRCSWADVQVFSLYRTIHNWSFTYNRLVSKNSRSKMQIIMLFREIYVCFDYAKVVSLCLFFIFSRFVVCSLWSTSNWCTRSADHPSCNPANLSSNDQLLRHTHVHVQDKISPTFEHCISSKNEFLLSYQRCFTQQLAATHKIANGHVEVGVTTAPVGNLGKRMSGQNFLKNKNHLRCIFIADVE